jgi:PEP-CTERM motif
MTVFHEWEDAMMKTLGVLAGLLLLPSVVWAVPVLKFDDPLVPGGTVTYDGAGGPAIGTDILFQSIQGLDTPLNAGVTLACVGCELDFVTDANLSEGPPLWNFGPGGTLTLTGAVPGLGLPAGTVLLSGTFVGTPNEIIGVDFGLFAAVGTDTKDPTLAAFYGLTPTDFTLGTTSIQAILLPDASGAFAGTVVNADLNNTQPGLREVPVPLPATVWLLGLGVLGLCLKKARQDDADGSTTLSA